MKYLGSKARFSKELLDIILPYRKDRVFIEPFCGGCNITDKVSGNRIAADNNIFIIDMWNKLIEGWVPPDTLSEEEYKYYKSIVNTVDLNNKDLTSIIGFVGVGCSYAGKWFGGYARSNTNKGVPRNHCLEAKKSVLKQVSKLKDVKFKHCNYSDLCVDSALVYCDPPYNNVTTYKDKFDSNKFWNWVEHNSINNDCKIFVSEYSAPKQFECIWEKNVENNFDVNRIKIGKKYNTEKLFVYKG